MTTPMTSRSAGVGCSQLRDPAAAATAAVTEALEDLGGAASVVFCFASAAYAPQPLAAAARAAAGPAHVLGCGASGILYRQRELEGGTAVAALAIATEAKPRAFFHTEVSAEGIERGLAVVLGDGYTIHPDRLASALQAKLAPGVPLVGGLAVGPQGVVPAFRWLDGEVVGRGAVGIVLQLESEPVIGFTQGCKPIGPLLTVTGADGNVLKSLDGKPAFEVFAEQARPLLDDLPQAAQRIFLARSVDDGFVVRGFLGFDKERGLLAVSEPMPEGTQVRFALRDAYAARESLRAMIEDTKRRLAGRTPRYGLYFNCAGRGRSLFGVEDHDAAFIHDALGDFPLIGIFGGGEIGPVGKVSRMHLFAGVLAVVA